MTSGVGSIEELSNVITAAPFQINGNPNAYAWTGTARASSSTETTPNGSVRTNLCTNPSFETNTTGWTANRATIAQDDEWSTGGDVYSLKVTASGASADSFGVIGVSLTTGHTYTVSATIRLSAALSGTLSAHSRRINVWNPSVTTVFESAAASNAAGQTRLSVTFTAAATGTFTVRLYNGSPTSGQAVWWDDVLVEEAPSLGAYFDGDSAGYSGSITGATNGVVLRTNLCTNPSFETSAASWFTSGGSTLAQSATRAFSGTKSLLVTWPTAAVHAAAVGYALSGLTVGAVYTASAYVYVPSGSADVVLEADTPTFGSPTSVKNAWTRITVTFAAPASAAAIRLMNATASTSGQTAYLDAVLVEQRPDIDGYFDGATTDTDAAVYAWTGTAHASISTKTGAYVELVSIPTATEADQIELTRDSNPGVIVFEDPDGTIQIFDAVTYRTA